MKSTELNLKNFFIADENLNPETCFPYTEKDDILNGPQYIYEDGTDKAIHNRTKDIEGFSIFEKKIMEKKRKEYLKTGKTKKPTDILVFTDGYSFSCASDFIKGLQAYGHGIIVGYNARPDINKSEFDASQSNSGAESFEISENVKNLRNLGFFPRMTYKEYFSPYDRENPKIPFEFKIYPVDEISSIYKSYIDERYNRFIEEAKRIFKNYSEYGACNPDNKLLYYETSDCDSQINVSNAHGGYICGDDGKWNKSNCIAAYCDDGYYLNEDKSECIQDPCQKIKLNEIIIREENKTDFIIRPNEIYIFTIERENASYYFYSEIEPFFYVMNEENHILESAQKGKEFENNDKIYVNYYVNITKDIKITIKEKNYKEEEDKDEDDDDGLSTGVIILIIICSAIAVISIILIIIFVISRKKRLSDKDIEEKTEQLAPMNP